MSTKLYMEILEGMGFVGERARQAMGSQRIMERVYREAATTQQAYNFQNTGTKAGGKSVSGGGGGKPPAVEVQQGTSLVLHSTLNNAAVNKQQYSQYISQQESALANIRSQNIKLYSSEKANLTNQQDYIGQVKALQTNIEMARQSQAVGVGFGEFSQSGMASAEGRQTIQNMNNFNRVLSQDVEDTTRNAIFGSYYQSGPDKVRMGANAEMARLSSEKISRAELAREQAIAASRADPRHQQARMRHSVPEPTREEVLQNVGLRPEEIARKRNLQDDEFVDLLTSPNVDEPLKGAAGFMGRDAMKASIPSADQIARGLGEGFDATKITRGDIISAATEELRALPGAMRDLSGAIGRSKALDGLGYYSGSAAIGIGAMSMAEGEISMGSVVGGAMAGVGGGVVGRLAAGSLKGGFLNQGMGAMGRGIGGAADDAYFAGARNTVGSSMTNAANALSGMSDATMTRTMRGMTFAGAGLTGYSMGRDRDHSRGFNSGRGNRF